MASNPNTNTAHQNPTGYEHLSDHELHQLHKQHRHSQHHGHGVQDRDQMDRVAEESRRRGKKGVSLAGDIVGDVARGLEVGGHKNPVSRIVGAVASGLKRGAGEK